MLDKLVSNYALNDLLEIEGCACAIADENKRILWNNKTFKSLTAAKPIKGKNISAFFPELNELQLDKIGKSKSLRVPLSRLNGFLTITQLKSKNKIEGFFLTITKVLEPSSEESDSELLQKNLLFQKELQNILTLLVKENSLSVLAEEILLRCISISKSNYGFVAFYEDKKKYDYIMFDPNSHIQNAAEIKKEIEANFSFINKWLTVNKRALVSVNLPNNIGYSLTEVLESKSLIIAPCFFDNSLLASIIIGKKDDTYTPFEITNTEHFAALLSFAISSIRTRELNTALESRLVQSQKLETIGKLTSGMAHDFSNLLSSIFGSLNLLKKKVPKNDDILRLLDNIENCSIRAKDLTKGLLSYGKPTPKRKELIKPNILVNEISKVITQTFPKNIKFESNVDTVLYDVLGNGTEIYQVLLNLCVNAKEAIAGKGTITLNARNIVVDEKNRLIFPLLEMGKYVRFSVIDTGTGIREDHLRKIFDPYFSTKEKETGSGLGLYVTYGIIKAHKGHVEVSSVLGKGTVFDVFFPSYEPALMEKISTDKIILLADDEIMLRDLLAELLESNGYNVIKVSTGVEALKILTEEIKVDLVIIDYNMPEMNGLDCIETIRDIGFKMPILLSTGSLSIIEDFELEKIGVTSMLPKPYEFDTMLATIKKLI
jgi:signal transduction histidine kinase/CheY-like chemotaxis protein